ncbi:MAG: hypothetical protein HWE22_00915 [Flavobacteriales bacterium]|nr:hypothetical protein [Flavobacteriales bacterium]
MNKILTEQIVQQLPNRSLEELTQHFLNKNHVLSRSMAAIQIGLSMHSNYPKYSQLLLQEMTNEIHFEYPKLGISSAWTIAVILAENLKQKDYYKLKKEFSKWSSEEKDSLFDWLKNYPEQRNILEYGKINP